MAALAEAITGLIRDKHKFTDMGVAAREAYEASFTPQIMLKKVTRIYEELCR